MSTTPVSWYIRGEGNQPAGPFTAKQLIQSLQANRLHADTICWREGMAQWLPMGEVEPFASAMQRIARSDTPQGVPAEDRQLSSSISQQPSLVTRPTTGIQPAFSRRLPSKIAVVASCIAVIGLGLICLLAISLSRDGGRAANQEHNWEANQLTSGHRRDGDTPEVATKDDTAIQVASHKPNSRHVESSPAAEVGNEASAALQGEWLYRTGSFGINLLGMRRQSSADARNMPTDLQRGGESLHHYLEFEFLIVKLGDVTSAPEAIPIVVADDHGNEYDCGSEGSFSGDIDRDGLVIDLTSPPLTIEGTRYHNSGPSDLVMSTLPNGFAYVDTVTIRVPEEAVLKSIRFGNSTPRPLDSLVVSRLKLLNDFGSLTWKQGSSVKVGQWLTFTYDGMAPQTSGVGWDILMRVNNREYNPVDAAMIAGVQYCDGAIYWGSGSESVPGSSEAQLRIGSVLPVWTDEGPPQPVALFLLFACMRDNAAEIKVVPLSSADIPPRVGQGADEQDYHAFKNAYSVQGGREVMGDATSHVSWLRGKDKPHEPSDMLVQHFGAHSQLGPSAILWDKQEGAEDAYVIHGGVWQKWIEEFTRTGRPGLGFPVRLYKSPETTYDQFDFENGYVASADGDTWHVLPYEDGKIAFVSDRDGNEEIYVTDLAGRRQSNLTNHPAKDRSPTWSPDGRRIVFVSDRGGEPGVYIMDADGSNVQLLAAEGEDPCWFPDGATIAFVRKLQFRDRGRLGMAESGDWLYGLFTMRADGSSRKQLPIDPRTVRKSRTEDWQGNIRRPNVSPDGTTIAFAAGDWSTGHEYEIVLYQVRTGKLTAMDQLSGRRGGLSCDNPSASRDGARLAFRGDTGHLTRLRERDFHGGQLYWMDMEGNRSEVCENVWCWGKIEWSADGQTLAFTARSRRQDILNVCIARLDGRVVRYITDGKANNYDPSWWVPESSRQLLHKADKQ